jgi:hypothetical protein
MYNDNSRMWSTTFCTWTKKFVEVVKMRMYWIKRETTPKVRRLSMVFAVFLASLFLTTYASATAYVQSWDLVDSGKHMDYDGNSTYMSNVDSGAAKWNAYKSGVIRKDSASVLQDVYVSDVNNANNINATTSSAGTIKMNVYNLGSQSSTQVTRVATHELGHCLGLDHSTSSDIMYAYTITTSSLTQNDKDSYDAAYLNY